MIVLGQPVCMGYDNYGMLLNSSDSNKSKLLDSTVSSQYHRHHQHHNQHQYHSNRRDHSTVSAEYERHRKQKLREKMPTGSNIDDQQNQLQQQPQVIDPELIRAKNEEENRMVNDTFKAQTIKSLTFKSVVTY